MKVVFLVLAAFAPALFATIPFPASASSIFFLVSLSHLALAILFLILSSYVVSKGGATATGVLAALIVLELASYIPRSLSIAYEALRVGGLAVTAMVVVVLWTKQPHRPLIRPPFSFPQSFPFSSALSS